jgi:hypothetical protein
MFVQRNNLPAVRQYLETFTIVIYLKFPMLVRALSSHSPWHMQLIHSFLVSNIILSSVIVCFWGTIICRPKNNLFLFFMTKGCVNRWHFSRMHIFLLLFVYLFIHLLSTGTVILCFYSSKCDPSFKGAGHPDKAPASIASSYTAIFNIPSPQFTWFHSGKIMHFWESLKWIECQGSDNLQIHFICSSLSTQCCPGCGLLCYLKLQKMQSERTCFQELKSSGRKFRLCEVYQHTSLFLFVPACVLAMLSGHHPIMELVWILN